MILLRLRWDGHIGIYGLRLASATEKGIKCFVCSLY
jgi:hypothetical protein